MSIQRNDWRLHKKCTSSCQLIKRIIKMIQQWNSSVEQIIDSARSSILQIPSIEHIESDINSKLEGKTEASNVLNSSIESDQFIPFQQQDIQSQVQYIQSLPLTPYNRFMDICDDAQVDWEQFLQDRDERLRLRKVVAEANQKLLLLDKKLNKNAINIMSQMTGKRIFDVKWSQYPVLNIINSQIRKESEIKSQQNFNDQDQQ